MGPRKGFAYILRLSIVLAAISQMAEVNLEGGYDSGDRIIFRPPIVEENEAWLAMDSGGHGATRLS
jgi:hypothetical protein